MELRKRMPEEVVEQLSQIDRIKAHVQDNYELLEEDEAYYEILNKVFILVFEKQNQTEASTLVRSYFPDQDGRQLLDDVVLVFGNFFNVNKQAKRYLQEKRHMQIFHKAIKSGELFTAEEALKSIDRLYGLYDESSYEIGTSKALPGLDRSSDPKLLE